MILLGVMSFCVLSFKYIRSVEGHGAFIKVFHFNLEESKGHFILGWATKNSSMITGLTGHQALELIFSPVSSNFQNISLLHERNC